MKNLEARIREMNRELLDIKTSQPLISSMRTFYYLYDIYFPEDEIIYYEISYIPGTQPIMTRIYSDSSVNFIAFKPSGDKQIFCNGRTFGGDIGITILSTRQVLAIRRVA